VSPDTLRRRRAGAAREHLAVGRPQRADGGADLIRGRVGGRSQRSSGHEILGQTGPQAEQAALRTTLIRHSVAGHAKQPLAIARQGIRQEMSKKFPGSDQRSYSLVGV